MKKEGMVIPQDFDEKRKRTVFVRDIPKAMEEELLVRFFSDKIGPNCVKEAKMVIDNHGSPMGCAYVEFANELLIPKALSLTLTRIFNTPIVIEQVDSDLLETTAEFKRRKARFELDTNKVFVGNLPRKMTEDHIRKLFTPFAPVDQVGFFKDSNGKFLGFASIVFSTLAGRKVTQEMNRFLIAGRNLHVDFEIEKVSALAKELVSNDISPEKILQLGETIDKYIDPHTFQMKADEDHETETAAEPEPAISTAGTSNCCVIHNCFDPEEEEPQEVIPDVQEEFEEIYGSVSHIAADMDNLGDVYVRFATAEGKEKCEQDFAKGKFVSGKKASCEEVSDMMYKVKFPHAKS